MIVWNTGPESDICGHFDDSVVARGGVTMQVAPAGAISVDYFQLLLMICASCSALSGTPSARASMNFCICSESPAPAVR